MQMMSLAASSGLELQALQVAVRHVTRLALLGPEGTWTHQAALELWPGTGLQRHFMPAEDMPRALQQGEVRAILLPARTSLVGDTPYLSVLHQCLALDGVALLARYARMLGYSLLATAQATLQTIESVYAHPVALAEAGPWLTTRLPHAQRVEAESAGWAAHWVAQAADVRYASLGPALAGRLHGLESVASGIEEGPHNVTEWWVVGYVA